MTCNPCKISVRPARYGIIPQYAGCLSRENGAVVSFCPAGITVKPESFGINVKACELPPIPPSEVLTPELLVEDITADYQASEIEITFTEELDPVCDWETGVTITVDGVPVNILSVTPTGGTDPWPYIYEIDVTLGVNETIVWSFDAAVGEICALSGTKLGDSTLTTTTPIPDAGIGSDVWLNPATIVESSPGIPITWDNDARASGGPTYDMGIGVPVLPLTTGLRNGQKAIISAGQAGGGGFMQSAVVPDFVAPFTIFFVGGFDAVANGAGLFDAKVSFTNRVAMHTGTFPDVEIYALPMGTLTSQPRDNNAHVWAVRIESSNIRSRISGSAWQTNASASVNNFDYGVVLTDINSGLNAAGWAGEVIIFNSSLSDAEMDWRFDRLKSDWSII